jgi:hypothetical protein
LPPTQSQGTPRTRYVPRNPAFAGTILVYRSSIGLSPFSQKYTLLNPKGKDNKKRIDNPEGYPPFTVTLLYY